MYGVVWCQYDLEDDATAQEKLAIKIVVLDQLVMALFLLFWVALTFSVTVDSMQHNDKIFKTKEFSI